MFYLLKSSYQIVFMMTNLWNFSYHISHDIFPEQISYRLTNSNTTSKILIPYQWFIFSNNYHIVNSLIAEHQSLYLLLCLREASIYFANVQWTLWGCLELSDSTKLASTPSSNIGQYVEMTSHSKAFIANISNIDQTFHKHKLLLHLILLRGNGSQLTQSIMHT